MSQVESWLFGAGIFIPFWKQVDADEDAGVHDTDGGIDGPGQVCPSRHVLEDTWGYRFAEKLLRETLYLRFHGDQGKTFTLPKSTSTSNGDGD
jgi:hypothetical protein